MAEIEKKKVSELTEETNPSGFWLFGYKELANGARQSVKVLFNKLLDVITDAASNLQLERRISLAMEGTRQAMLFGEETTIYKVDSDNISKLEISIDGENTFEDIPLDSSNVSVTIPAKTKAVFRLTQVGVGSEMFIYLYAKVKAQ